MTWNHTETVVHAMLGDNCPCHDDIPERPLTQWSLGEIAEAMDDAVRYLDGDVENGPRIPTPDQIKWLAALHAAQERLTA